MMIGDGDGNGDDDDKRIHDGSPLYFCVLFFLTFTA